MFGRQFDSAYLHTFIIMIDNAKILLTIYLGGRLLGNRSKKLNKALKHKVICSPFEHYEGKLLVTPEKHFKAPNDHVDSPIEIVCRKTSLGESFYNQMISDNVPDKFNTYKGRMTWQSWSLKQRLEWHLNQFDEGYGISYELID